MKEINLFRIIFATLFAFFIIAGFVIRPDIETNILKSILPENETSTLLLNLSNKTSAKVNIIIESNDENILNDKITQVTEAIQDSDINFTKTNYQKLFSIYKNHVGNFLSASTKNELLNQNYDKVVSDAKVRLYDPLNPPVLSIEDDPFLLLQDFLASIYDSEAHFYNENGKFYWVSSYSFDENLSLSSSEFVHHMKKLIEIQDRFSDKNTKIYFSGSPVHSYYAMQNAVFDINLVSIVSIIFILIVVFWYFHSFMPIEALIVSILSAILTGFAACSLFFHTVHILTFVFSATIIGICTDYSLHFFVESIPDVSGEDAVRRILKSLTISLITTLSAFAVLFFSNVFLLKQISVFTISGLICVYIIVILFYPVFYNKIKNPNKNKKFNFNLSKIMSVVIFGGAICIIAAGFGVVKLNSDVTSLYTPKGELLEAEKLYSSLTQKNRILLLIKSNILEDFQNHIEHEEWIINNLLQDNKNAHIEAFSKYLPSIKTQKENSELVSAFYDKKLSVYADFLNTDQVSNIMRKMKNADYVTYIPDIDNYLNSFLVLPNASIVIADDTSDIFKILIDERVYLVDIKGDISAIVQMATKRCISLILPVFTIMFVILSVVFGNKKALILILPSFIGSCLAITIPALLHQEINFFHILSVFLIIGFGVDYSIFRFNSSDKSSDAVFLSAITTILSFSLLAFTSFKLISSIGLTLSIGLVFSYLFSLILVEKRKK